jgi:hypothetical protein
MNLTDDELALRRAFDDVVAGAVPPRTTTVETLDRAVHVGRRRRLVRRSSTVAGAAAGLVLVVGATASLLPVPAPRATGGPAGSAASTLPTPTSTPTPVPTPPPGMEYGSSGVPNSAWPSAAWITTVAKRVVAAGGGSVLSTTPGIDYYEPPTGYDSARKPLWAKGSHLRTRSVEIAVSTPQGDYLVDVAVSGNNPKDADGTPNQAYFPPSFDMSRDTPGVVTLVSGKDGKVFAYANKAFAERKTLQAMVWRTDSLLLDIVVTNYGVETAGGKKTLGPSWSQLGLTAQDLLDAAR